MQNKTQVVQNVSLDKTDLNYAILLHEVAAVSKLRTTQKVYYFFSKEGKKSTNTPGYATCTLAGEKPTCPKNVMNDNHVLFVLNGRDEYLHLIKTRIKSQLQIVGSRYHY